MSHPMQAVPVTLPATAPVVDEPLVARRHVIHPDAPTVTWIADPGQTCPECFGPWLRPCRVTPGEHPEWASLGGTCDRCRYVGVGDLIGRWAGHEQPQPECGAPRPLTFLVHGADVHAHHEQAR